MYGENNTHSMTIYLFVTMCFMFDSRFSLVFTMFISLSLFIPPVSTTSYEVFTSAFIPGYVHLRLKYWIGAVPLYILLVTLM